MNSKTDESESLTTTAGPGPALNRRRFLTAAAGAATAGAVSTTPRFSPIGRAQAIAPAIVAGAVAAGLAYTGATAALGWALREYEVIGSDDPPEGLTADALETIIYDDARKRLSNNRSTFVDNLNIVESGLENTLYAEGKIAAIDALNDQQSQSAVQAAALDTMQDYAATIQANILKSWNESVHEAENNYSAAVAHGDVMEDDVFIVHQLDPEADSVEFPDSAHSSSFGTTTRQLDLVDGSQFGVERVVRSANEFDPAGITEGYGHVDFWLEVDTSAGAVQYLRTVEWMPVWDSIESTINTVNDGLIMWVDGVYSNVQAGDLDTADLLTPRELAEITSDEEGFNQAIADLMALNVAVDLEREAEIYLPDVDATVYGSIATTAETTLEVGTVDPSADAFGYYLTYDISQGEGTWASFQAGVDGGTATFTAEPYQQTVYYIDTSAGETAEVSASDFTDVGDGTWTVDLSDQLENQITEIATVEFYSEIETAQYETVQLEKPFEIVTFTDDEGTEHDSATYTRSEPQDDTNYITEEEWQAQEDRYKELIEKYEESSGGGGGGFLDGIGGGGSMAALGAIGALLAAVLLGNR